MLLNPDVMAIPGLLDRLVAFMEEHPDAGIAAPQLFHDDGTLQPNCRRFPTPGTLALRALRIDEIWKGPRMRRYLMESERSGRNRSGLGDRSFIYRAPRRHQSRGTAGRKLFSLLGRSRLVLSHAAGWVEGLSRSRRPRHSFATAAGSAAAIQPRQPRAIPGRAPLFPQIRLEAGEGGLMGAHAAFSELDFRHSNLAHPGSTAHRTAGGNLMHFAGCRRSGDLRARALTFTIWGWFHLAIGLPNFPGLLESLGLLVITYAAAGLYTGGALGAVEELRRSVTATGFVCVVLMASLFFLGQHPIPFVWFAHPLRLPTAAAVPLTRSAMRNCLVPIAGGACR